MRAAMSIATLSFCACSLAASAYAQGGEADAQRASAGGDERAPVSDRFEWLVLTASTSYRALDLQKIEFEGDDGAQAKLIPATSGGFSPAVGIGARLWFVSLMLRTDVTFLSESAGVVGDDLTLWNLDLEAAFRMSDGRVQPYALLGLGYSALGGIGDVLDDVRRGADAQGANARLGIGLDYYLSEVLTLGARFHVAGLLLSSHASVRDLATPKRVDTLGETKTRLREADGSIFGLSYVGGLVFGVHLF